MLSDETAAALAAAQEAAGTLPDFVLLDSGGGVTSSGGGRRELQDQLGFPVEAEERERFARHVTDYAARDRAHKEHFDAMLRAAGWDALAPPPRATLLANDSFCYLAFKGIPQAHRPALWGVLSGAQELRQREAPGYYEGLLRTAVERLARLPAAEEIEKDLHRTFPGHWRFTLRDAHTGIDPLRRVLLAYSVRNTAVGYTQSMNVLAGFLLLVVGAEEEAFWLLCAIAEIACPKYYTRNMIGCQVDMKIFGELLGECCGALTAHCEEAAISLPLVTTKWFLCVFVGILPTDTVLRLWDTFFLHGTLMLFRAAISILKMAEPRILAMGKTQDIISELQSFPRSIHDHRELYRNIRSLTDISHRKIDILHKKYSLEVRQELQKHHKSKDVQALLRVTHFSRDELSRLWNKFALKEDLQRTASGEAALNFSQFQEVFFAAIPAWHPDERALRQLFGIFDRDGDGLLVFKEWVCGLSMVCSADIDEKVTLLFRAYDRDRDGYIDKSDMQALLGGIYTSIGNPMDESKVCGLVEKMFRELGIVGNSLLALEDFKKAIQLEPLVAQYLAEGMLGDCGETIDVDGEECSSTPTLKSTPGEFFGVDAEMPRRRGHFRLASEAAGKTTRKSMLRRISRLFAVEPRGTESNSGEDDEDDDDSGYNDFAHRFGRLETCSASREYPTEEDVHIAPAPAPASVADPMAPSPLTPRRHHLNRPSSTTATLMQPLLSGVDVEEEVESPQEQLQPLVLARKPSSQRLSFDVGRSITPVASHDAPEPNYSCWRTIRSWCCRGFGCVVM